MSLAVTPSTPPTHAQKPLSRRWAVMAFVASSLVTASLAVMGGYATQALESRHADRKADYDRFRDLTENMDKSVTAFMDAYLETAPVDAAGRPHQPLPLDDATLIARRHAIEANIQAQDAALEEIAIGLDKSDAKAVSAYRDQMAAVYQALENPVPAQDGKVLMQAIAEARDTRIDVLAALQNRARRLL